MATNKKIITEHTVHFTQEDMDALHKGDKLVKTDPDGKEHTYTYTEPEQLADEKLTEGVKYSVIDPRGNTVGSGEKMQASQMAKKKGGTKKGFYVVQAKNGLKARRAIEKANGKVDDKFQDHMSDLYWEGVLDESSDNYRKALEKIARDKQLAMLSAKDKATLLKIAQMMKTANESTTSTGSKLNEEYIESMDSMAIDKHLSAIEMQWLDWKRGPMTEKEDIKPAGKELTHYILLWMRKKFR